MPTYKDIVNSREQPYGGNAPSVRGSDTSEAAADSMQDSLGDAQARVYQEVHRRRGRGRTCDEVEDQLRMRHQTASARIRELYLKGLLFDSGERRRTRSNRSAVVWVATAHRKSSE